MRPFGALTPVTPIIALSPNGADFMGAPGIALTNIHISAEIIQLVRII